MCRAQDCPAKHAGEIARLAAAGRHKKAEQNLPSRRALCISPSRLYLLILPLQLSCVSVSTSNEAVLLIVAGTARQWSPEDFPSASVPHGAEAILAVALGLMLAWQHTQLHARALAPLEVLHLRTRSTMRSAENRTQSRGRMFGERCLQHASVSDASVPRLEAADAGVYRVQQTMLLPQVHCTKHGRRRMQGCCAPG